VSRGFYWSMPFICVDHDVSLPAIPSTPRAADGGDHLIVGFATSIATCQHIDSFPQVLCAQWPSRRFTFHHAICSRSWSA